MFDRKEVRNMYEKTKMLVFNKKEKKKFGDKERK